MQRFVKNMYVYIKKREIKEFSFPGQGLHYAIAMAVPKELKVLKLSADPVDSRHLNRL